MKPILPANDLANLTHRAIRFRALKSGAQAIDKTLPFIRFASSLLLFLIPCVGIGQSIRGGAIFLQGGQSVWPGLAQVIQQVNHAPSPMSPMGNDRYVMLGAEGYFRLNRWVAGINVSTLANQRLQDVATQSVIESSASNVHLWVGWIAWQTNRAKLYPSLGPGLNSFNVNSTTASGTMTTHVLDGFATDISLSFDWLIMKSDAVPTLFAPMLSVRAGYRLTTASAEWHGDRNGATMLLPTRYTPQGFYLTVGLGGGVFHQR
ncbi:hypothetical protein [Spirosoma flavum]|uniref:Outer membrane beta-barrel protein n=1 Tax=Spirosoma flavum TaxID=2048557 RepID=A0ABW6AIN8_9BACT